MDDKLLDAFKKLSINKGDTLLVRADLGAIGRGLGIKNRLDYINILLDAVGEDGTIVALSFTSSFFIKSKSESVFDGSNKSYTGAFANLMLAHPDSIRSQHPTNSYVAIGKNAGFILDGHDENDGAYEPVRKVMSLNGKVVLIGCVSTSPGFTTAHLAEIDLGLHKKFILPTLNRAYYMKGGEKKLFKRTDLGGCSSTFFKFYSYYVYHEILRQGYIGNAYTIVASASACYEIEKNILSKEPKFNVCESPDCMLCRFRRWDNLKSSPLYILKSIIKFVKGKVKC